MLSSLLIQVISQKGQVALQRNKNAPGLILSLGGLRRIDQPVCDSEEGGWFWRKGGIYLIFSPWGSALYRNSRVRTDRVQHPSSI